MAQNSILGGSDLNGSEDEVDFPPNDYVYRKRDIAFVGVGIVTLLLDWVSTGMNYYCYYLIPSPECSRELRVVFCT